MSGGLIELAKANSGNGFEECCDSLAETIFLLLTFLLFLVF
jgi:hypothetical protein